MHDSMARDIGLSFSYLFPEWEIKFEYEPVIANHKPDLVVKMMRDGRVYKFWVEVERKKECYRDVMKKVAIFEKVKKSVKGMNKCLIVLCTTLYNPFLRPQEYGLNPVDKQRIEMNNAQFNRFVKSKLSISNDYLFLNFINFHRLNESVWYQNGQPRKLIQ